LLAQKKRTKEKGSLKSFLGLTSYRLPTHFTISKMLIYFQKRFDGIYSLMAIWVRTSSNKNIRIIIWVSTGLREFWEIAIGLKLAARALSKQYCLSDAERSRGRTNCIACASRKT